MSTQIKKRKNRFWSLFMAVVLIVGTLSALPVFAAGSYELNLESGRDKKVVDENGNLKDFVYSGDKLKLCPGLRQPNTNPILPYEITYLDMDGTGLIKESYENSNAHNDNGDYYYEFTVADYPETGIIDAEYFKGWDIVDVYVSGGYQATITFKATKYEAGNIEYVLNGGTNNSANPDKYMEGKCDVELKAATRTGYTFEGWYTDSDYRNKVTKISVNSTGNITLYAKFTVNEYDVEYVLDGGENNASNPTKYTYGIGVEELKDATKEGHTFEGWYSDSSYDNKVTKIEADATETVTLYAKFTIKETEQEPVDEPNDEPEDVPASETKVIVYTLLMIVCVAAVMGMYVVKKYIRKRG